MIFYFPKPNFIPIAISTCKLNCKHCMGKYLKQMKTIDEGEKLIKFAKNYNGIGFLISGGFDKEGRLIGLKEMLPTLKKLKNRFYIAVHPGFVDDELSKEIANACHVAFIDLPSENAIKNVFGLNASTEDYFENMDKLLNAGVKAVPHITIGLNFGKVEEYDVLDELKKYKNEIEKLVLNIVVPTTKTPFEKVKISKEEVLEFVRYAKDNFKVSIGCMRPRSLDIDLIDVGINEMATPSKKAIEYAESKFKRIEIRNYCCGLIL